MANVLTTNPIKVDTTGTIIAAGTECKVIGIIVNASLDIWSVILTDVVSGNVIFRADSSLVNHRSVYWSPASPWNTLSGIYATTLTNITYVLIYTTGRTA